MREAVSTATITSMFSLQKVVRAVSPYLLLVGACILIGLLFWGASIQSERPEIEELRTATDFSFQDYSSYFQKLADKKGAEYAFEILGQASLPQGVDIHLLAHVVGDVLYKQQGIKGINACTPDFRNACSHSVVIGVLNDRGEGALPEIAETCKKAPGGKGAYTMCFHGLGHGVLAFNGYNYEQAVGMCKKTGTNEYQDREYIECVGGMTMEMIAGVHDRGVWETQIGNYFKKEDPLYPCSADFMPSEVRPICYAHLTPHLFEVAGMDLGAPDPEFFEESFSYCEALPEENIADREACYGGFGKEFVVFAQGRDVRDIGSMQEPELREIRQWCSLANNVDGEIACNGYTLASLFWGGENNPAASLTYCAVAEGEDQDRCYDQLVNDVRTYLNGTGQGTEVCTQLPQQYQSACLSSVSRL